MGIERIFLLLLILIPAFNCSRRCDSFPSRPLKGKIEDYFGVYKLGNWWVYNNKMGKKDSQYVSDYTDTFVNDRATCNNIQRRMFAIVNTQLPGGFPQYRSGDSLYLTYEAGTNSITVRITCFYPATKQSASFPRFTYFLDRDSILSYFGPGYFGRNLFDSISLNGMKYHNILSGNDGTTTYYLEKNKGMVGWGNVLDTFNLTSFKIQ